MVAKAVPPTPGSKYRIKVGQTIGGLIWSNSSFTLQGFWTIVYDDGEPDFWPIAQELSGSSRAAVIWGTGQVAKKNGWVVGGHAGGGGTLQRGQAYYQAFVIDTNLTVVSDVIACGYTYAGHVVELGTFVEPGPAGGHGAQANNTLAGPAAGADFANYTAPTGSIQKVKGFFGQLTTGVGAANREFSIQLLSSTIRGGVVAGEIQTASLTVDYVGADGGVSSSGVTSNLAGGVTQIGLGNIILVAGINALQFKTYNIQAADQWGVGNLITEEWVMPN